MLHTEAHRSALTRRNCCSVALCVFLSSFSLARRLNALRDFFKHWRQAFGLRDAKQRNDDERCVGTVKLSISRQRIAQRVCYEIGFVHLSLIPRRSADRGVDSTQRLRAADHRPLTAARTRRIRCSARRAPAAPRTRRRRLRHRNLRSAGSRVCRPLQQHNASRSCTTVTVAAAKTSDPAEAGG